MRFHLIGAGHDAAHYAGPSETTSIVAKSTGSVQRKGRRLYEIDLLRFLAALMVVVLHFSYNHGQAEFDFAPALGQVTQYGYLGVELFFMISGLVVLMSVWGRSPGEFVASRVSRLYPAFWVAVTLTTLVAVLTGTQGRTGATALRYAANMTMFPQLANVQYTETVYWTLWSEWRFYLLLFGFSLIGITARRTVWLLWGWLAASVMLQVLPLPGIIADLAALIIQPAFSPYFVAGMALFLAYRFGPTKNLAVLLVVAYVNAVREAGDRVAERVADGQSPKLLVAALVIAGFFAVMTAVALGGLRWLRWRRLTVLGNMTYPLYLIHYTVGVAIFNVMVPALNPWVALPLVIAVLCGLAWLISVGVEDRLRPPMSTAVLRILRVPPRRRRSPDENQAKSEERSAS